MNILITVLGILSCVLAIAVVYFFKFHSEAMKKGINASKFGESEIGKNIKDSNVFIERTCKRIGNWIERKFPKDTTNPTGIKKTMKTIKKITNHSFLVIIVIALLFCVEAVGENIIDNSKDYIVSITNPKDSKEVEDLKNQIKNKDDIINKLINSIGEQKKTK